MKIVTLLLATLLSAASLASENIDNAKVSKDKIIVDVRGQLLEIRQDCHLYIHSESDVQIRMIDSRIRRNGKMIINVDGERMICNIRSVEQIA